MAQTHAHSCFWVGGEHLSLFQRNSVLEECLCWFKNGLILDNDVVACLRVRDHQLDVLFPIITLSMGETYWQPEVFASTSRTYPEKAIDACYSSVCPVDPFVERVGIGVEHLTPMAFLFV